MDCWACRLPPDLISQAPRIDTMAFLAILEWRFLRPIAFGDTIHAVSRVESLEPHANGRRGVVTWQRRVLNQDGLLVQEGRTQTLVRARSPATSSASGSETDNALLSASGACNDPRSSITIHYPIIEVLMISMTVRAKIEKTVAWEGRNGTGVTAG